MADDTRTAVVGVLGCGLMGSGIAQVCAQAGYRTIVREVDQAAVDAGLGRIERFLGNGVTRGKLTTEESDVTMGRLSGTTSFEPLAESDLIIEAIVENIDAKRAVFAAVEAVVGPDTLFCSNTSSVCITELAAATARPDKFIGLHFFSPGPIDYPAVDVGEPEYDHSEHLDKEDKKQQLRRVSIHTEEWQQMRAAENAVHV